MFLGNTIVHLLEVKGTSDTYVNKRKKCNTEYE